MKVKTVIRCLRSAGLYADDVCSLPTASSDEASETRTLGGFALSRLTSRAFPKITTAIAHIRGVLADHTYESRAR